MSETEPSGGAGRLAARWLRSLPLTPGGYAESLLQGWVEAEPTGRARERTSLAQLRLAYVFLHAGLLGVEGASAAGRAALDRANGVFWREDLRGWTRSADAEGASLDETVDTYDQAFGLLALAWDRDSFEDGMARAELARRRALSALAALDDDACPSGGYREFRNGRTASRLTAFPGHRRQNPHMHLLEAFLAWRRVDPEGPWGRRAAAIVDLLRTRFLDPDEGFLREYFDDSLKPVFGKPGSTLEPGHHFEWVWLLNEYRKASGDETVARQAKVLYEFASRRGVDADGLAFDAVDPNGFILAGTKLLWPQAEQLKAHLAMYEWTGDEKARLEARRTLRLILSRYLAKGNWLFANRLGRGGRPISEPTPSRVLYHLYLALIEADRSGI
jgi:mannose/cellobiose epimerase-like protein (N-acyl-D-glucosamine 2-epimerase family)